MSESHLYYVQVVNLLFLELRGINHMYTVRTLAQFLCKLKDNFQAKLTEAGPMYF